jgi:hypothetical protein
MMNDPGLICGIPEEDMGPEAPHRGSACIVSVNKK